MVSVTKKNKRAGRPIRGDQKRIRVSFTLQPRHVDKLGELSRLQRVSRSEALDQLIDQAEGEVPKISFKIPVPITELSEFCRRHGVSKLSFFGSVLTDRFGPESDIDILVEFKSGRVAGFFEIAEMEAELSRLFGGRKIDLRTFQDLSRYFREKVAQEAKVIYAAM